MRSRSAFTLLELLVVVSIIAILMGLLFSAVQRVRAAAARTKCQNNLKQLGLALHNYESGRGKLPPGNSYLNGKAPELNMGYETRILPYIEQDNLWREAMAAFQQQPFFEKPPHLSILDRVIPSFVCPMDARTQDAHAFSRAFRVAFTDYLGVWGTDYTKPDGVLFVDSAVRLIQIFDGTSNTLMIGERPPSADYNLGWWYAVGVRIKAAPRKCCSACANSTIIHVSNPVRKDRITLSPSRYQRMRCLSLLEPSSRRREFRVRGWIGAILELQCGFDPSGAGHPRGWRSRRHSVIVHSFLRSGMHLRGTYGNRLSRTPKGQRSKVKSQRSKVKRGR